MDENKLKKLLMHHNNIEIKDINNLNEKILKFKSDRPESIHIISDFDKTLTKVCVNGVKHKSTYAYLRDENYFDSAYSKKSHELHDKYYPLEISMNISQEEKIKAMEEWWTLHWKLMQESGINKNAILDVIKKKLVYEREGMFDFLEQLNKKSIPLLIFSAGIGNIIEEFLKSKNKYHKNIHIIANFFKFDIQGNSIGYTHPMIHVFNKNEVSIKNSSHFKNINNRKNVILLGDSLGDLGMSKGIDHEKIIKIGFLNDQIEESLKEYKSKFDIVIKNDGSMIFVNELLNLLLN
ncbi:hypothetical protein HOK51_06815 [Candidatus Woesearchaeota archaeon]|jgi:cytosolic 5'-nucleotidase 3|nr:hypothetical protein [Candidatus Woesearchaeota archaeon]MBT6519534.1 hypothetical protein [Candidatus Woesearchaeota archaeon]MBT7367721.1 hypothetical protein [Candidatus Woesearchaeota archaeon]